MKSAPAGMWITVVLAAIANRLGGDMRFQHLPVPFEVYADGIDLVVFEEFGSGAAALHLKTEMERNELIKDEAYRRAFRKDYDSKFGPRAWHRDFFDAEIVGCPDETVVGKSFGDVGVRAAGCTRWTPSSISSWSTAKNCAGAQRFPTTGRRCCASSRSRPASRWGSPTPARTCATWRSTTAGCACCATSAMSSARAASYDRRTRSPPPHRRVG